MPMRNVAANRYDQSVSRLIGSSGVQVFLRLCLCSAFLFSGASKLLDFQGAITEVRALMGIEPAALLAAVVIVVQLSGSGLMLAGGRVGFAGAALLAGFTFVATLLAHSAWIGAGAMQVGEANIFFEHVGLIAGLLLAGWLGAEAPEQWR